MAVTGLEIWLPPSAQWPPQPNGLARWLGRADPAPAGPVDSQALIESGFKLEAGLPVAALLRQRLAGDAGTATWLAADPAWIQPDMNGARLLAYQHMQLDLAQARSLAAALQPLFAEHEMVLQVDDPSYWQLRLPTGMPAPHLAAPSQAIGADVLAFVPAGAEGRRWRILFNEAQTVLHAHPLNQQRQAQAMAPVNSLWFWGGGTLPTQLSCRWPQVVSDDPVLLAAAVAAQARARDWASFGAAKPGAPLGAGLSLLDMQNFDRERFSAWLPWLQQACRRWPVRWRLSDGRCWQQQPGHRWRLWRGEWQA